METKLMFIVVISAFLVNCDKKKDSSTPAPATQVVDGTTVPVIPTPNGPYVPGQAGVGYGPGAEFTFGATVPFIFDSADMYRQYTERYINNLSQVRNARINLNFDKFGNSYGGTVTIRYELDYYATNQWQTYEGFFTSGHDSLSTKYNLWFTYAGNKVWHGFFEDFMGSIIVVIDGTASLADGYQTTDKVSGSIWFKNFAVDGPHPTTYCWFVTSGPFDCRTWRVDGKVQTTTHPLPFASDGYQRVGTFSDVAVPTAFNDVVL